MPLRPRYSPSDTPARITQHAMGQVVRQAGRVYRDIPLGGDPRGKGQTNYPYVFPGLIPAVVTTGITACSAASTPVPGTGQAQLWYYNDDTDAMVANPDEGPTSNGIVTVRNWYQNSGTIAAGKHIHVAYFANAYWLITADC